MQQQADKYQRCLTTNQDIHKEWMIPNFLLDEEEEEQAATADLQVLVACAGQEITVEEERQVRLRRQYVRRPNA